MYDLECSARERKPCLILVTKHFESIQKSGLAITDLFLSYFEIDLVIHIQTVYIHQNRLSLVLVLALVR